MMLTQVLIGLAGTGGIGCLLLGVALYIARRDVAEARYIGIAKGAQVLSLQSDLDLCQAHAEATRKRLEGVIAAKDKAIKAVLDDLQDCTTPSAIRARINRLVSGG